MPIGDAGRLLRTPNTRPQSQSQAGRVAPIHEIPNCTFAAEVVLHFSGTLGDCFDDLSGPRRVASVAWWIRTGGGSAQMCKPQRIQCRVIHCIARRPQGHSCRGRPEFLEKNPQKLSRPRPAERQNEKASVFLPFGTIRVCFFFVFSFRGPSARYSVFWCKIVAFILRVPSRPLLHCWAEHAFFAFFRGWGLAIL